MKTPLSSTNDERPLEYRARIEYARTPDDWDLALHRYPSTRTDLPPIIVCPGYACNRHFIDFDDRYSLARFLARRGFDTWVLEFRGRGGSEPVLGRRNRGWTFDDLSRFDAPTAIKHVRGRCANRPPVWIGHSMGGMVIYATLGEAPDLGDSVAGMVTMATPIAFPGVSSRIGQGFSQLLLRMPAPRRLPQRGVLLAVWALMARSAWAPEIGMNRANLDYDAFGRALPRFICNVAREKVKQFADWSLKGEFRSRDGRVDYRANLQRITTPALIIAAGADSLASPDNVGFAYDRIGSTSKTYREFATCHGDRADYGHVDLVFGHHAPEEVFTTIATWIETEIGPRKCT